MANKKHSACTGVELHIPKVHTQAYHSDVSSTGTEIDSAVSLKHARQHGIADTDDHTGVAIDVTGHPIIADVSGMPLGKGDVKLKDGEKLYLSNTTESYFIYEGAKVALYVNGTKVQDWG